MDVRGKNRNMGAKNVGFQRFALIVESFFRKGASSAEQKGCDAAFLKLKLIAATLMPA